MKNDYKVLAGILVFTFLLIVGGVALFGGEEEETKQVLMSQVMGVEANPESYDLGDVPLKGGIVTKEYEVINATEQPIKLKKIATSCMCTQAKVSVGGKETRFYGMEHAMDKNPPVNLEIGQDEVAKVTVDFDPAAHGPQGVGPFDRSVWLTFSDPAGIKELKFNGTVVSSN